MRTVCERHVQAVWYDAALRPPNLVTRRGSDVRVVSPGEWNLGEGPDFLNAVLELGRERRRVRGDVEIHLCPGDWDFHGHGSDPNYRNVIAHVTWRCGPEPSTLPAGAVSIWLGRFLAGRPEFSLDQIDLAAYPFARLPLGERPCERAFGHDPDRVRRVLSAAGRHRLAMKARRLVGRLCEAARRTGAAGRRQVFYEEVMTALGYARNQAAFRHVAERVPVAEFPREREAVRTALLAAGTFETWDRTGCRPDNQPERRLARAAAIFTETPVLAFSEARDFSPPACRKLIARLCGRERLMGPGRAAAVLANVIVPFALAEERIDSAPDWLPPEDISSPVRLTAFRLLGRDHSPAASYAKNGLLIQGLLQIRRDHCLGTHPDCLGCGLVRATNPTGLALSERF